MQTKTILKELSKLNELNSNKVLTYLKDLFNELAAWFMSVIPPEAAETLQSLKTEEVIAGLVILVMLFSLYKIIKIVIVKMLKWIVLGGLASSILMYLDQIG